MVEIIGAVVFFTVVVLVLVILIQVARYFLVPTGSVRIIVNGDESAALESPVGGKLLFALADKGIFVSSACGGTGTCGQCKIKVTEGGGSVIATEEAFLSSKEQHNGMRMACQVAVKQDLHIELPPEVFSAKVWDCEVLENNNISAFINEVIFKLPEDEEMNFKAGGYIQITRPGGLDIKYKDFNIREDHKAIWDKYNLFRFESKVDDPTERAYSMASYPGEKGRIILNIRIATPPFSTPDAPPGIVSSWIFSLKPGDKVSIAGPFGHFFAQDTKAEMVLIGGGAGMAPLRSIILDELTRKKSGRKISFWYGANDMNTMFYQDVFDKLAAENPNFTWGYSLVNPDPGWNGFKGFVHNYCYESYLKNHDAPEDCEYYLCGPPPMMAAVMKMLDDLGVPKENIFFDDFGS